VSAETQTEVRFSEEKLQKVQEIIQRYPKGKQKSALLPVLHLAQEEFGWLAVEVMDYVASLLSIKPIEVYEVATFYSMYHVKPVGKIVMEFCHTGPCALRGSDRIQKHIENRLNIKAGQTTEDGIFTLKTVECLASCGTGPMMQMGDYYYENLDEAKVDQLLEEWRNQAGSMKAHFRGRNL
jgi:NADH-quinone oxidoreductase subunit E